MLAPVTLCPLSGVKRTCILRHGLFANDAVDGARSAASKCYSVVALKREQFKEVRPLQGSGRNDIELKF